MWVLGVTGGIGSGKTAATDHFQALGITVVDADLASRLIVEPGRPALIAIQEHFGTVVITKEGLLDRRALRAIIFADNEQRRWLEALTHPLIAEEIVHQIQSSRSAYTVLSSPLLLESQQHQWVNRILVIDVPESVQVSRTVGRDSTTEDSVRAIMAAQISRSDRLNRADDIIVNDQDLAHLYGAIDSLHERYLALAKAQSKTGGKA